MTDPCGCPGVEHVSWCPVRRASEQPDQGPLPTAREALVQAYERLLLGDVVAGQAWVALAKELREGGAPAAATAPPFSAGGCGYCGGELYDAIISTSSLGPKMERRHRATGTSLCPEGRHP